MVCVPKSEIFLTVALRVSLFVASLQDNFLLIETFDVFPHSCESIDLEIGRQADILIAEKFALHKSYIYIFFLELREVEFSSTRLHLGAPRFLTTINDSFDH